MNKNGKITAAPAAIEKLWTILETAVDNDTLTPDIAESLMDTARTFDPTESGIAAELRDFIRDNTELSGF